MRFRWNNAWQQRLTATERHAICIHEQGHLAHAALSPREKSQIVAEMEIFARGEPCAEPLGDESLCSMDTKSTEEP